MKIPITYILRNINAEIDGEVVNKFKPAPKIKPPRRNPNLKNKTDRSDYMQNYMNDYRKEKGKDYQKTPDSLKELKKKQKLKLKEKFNLKNSELTVTGENTSHIVVKASTQPIKTSNRDYPSNFLIL